MIGGVRKIPPGSEVDRTLDQAVDDALLVSGDLETVRIIDKNFSSGTYTLRLLFRAMSRKFSASSWKK